MIKSNISRILEDISLICQQLGRNPNDIVVVGVTKFASIDMVRQAVNCGLSHIAENKVQHAVEKFSTLENAGANITKHMIGHLQTNKVKKALEIFDIIQSVDSLKLAEAINSQALQMSKIADILIQVNTSGEQQKYGIALNEAKTLLNSAVGLKNLRILGLMTMAPFVDDEEIIRNSFRKLKQLQDEITGEFSDHERLEMKYLSMGMTGDYKIAIEEGSNMVRIGRAIFSDE